MGELVKRLWSEFPNFLWRSIHRYRLECLTTVGIAIALVLLAKPLWGQLEQWPAAWWALALGASLLMMVLGYVLLQWAAPHRHGGARARFWRLLQVSTASVLVVLGAAHWWHLHPWSTGRQALFEQYICELGLATDKLDEATRNALLPGQRPEKCWPVVRGPGKNGLPSTAAGDALRAKYQWVQCAPVGPRRCASIAWLTQQQRDQALSQMSPAPAVVAVKSTRTAVAPGPAIPGPEPLPPPKAEGNGQGFDQVLAAIATVLGVVLAVTTLIATKTATDARNEVREELRRLDAAKQAERGALHAQAAMLAAMLMQTQQRLVSQYFRPNEPLRGAVAVLVSMLRPLTEVLYSLSGLSSGRNDADTVVANVDKLLTQIQLKPLRQLPEHLLGSTLRSILRDVAALLHAHQDLLNRSGRSFTDTENKARDRLARLAHQLGDV